MPIKGNSAPKSMTLEEFYTELSSGNDPRADGGKSMLELIKMINETFKETQLWGLTSHYRLLIQAKDNQQWYFMVYSFVKDIYCFEYPMSEEKRPWSNAFITGHANSLEEARKYFLISMRESGGWQGNPELQKLLEKYEIV